VHNPKLAKVAGPFGAHFRTGYSLSEREIAVCIINSKWHSIFPTNAHERAGKAAGLPEDKVEAILSGLPTSFSDAREQVVYAMATCLANSRWVAKGLYDRAVEALGHVGITDVICLMGHNRRQYLCRAIFQYRSAADGVGENAGVPIKSGRSPKLDRSVDRCARTGLNQSPARSADRARQAAGVSARGASPASDRAAAAHRGSPG
jgi:4-carboxymuconolactone decarboxylase